MRDHCHMIRFRLLPLRGSGELSTTRGRCRSRDNGLTTTLLYVKNIRAGTGVVPQICIVYSTHAHDAQPFLCCLNLTNGWGGIWLRRLLRGRRSAKEETMAQTISTGQL